MEFRHTQDAPVEEMSVDHFCNLVRAGKVGPTCLYRTPWTNGEWRTVDNFRPFHKSSSSKYPIGDKLREELRGEGRKKQQAAEFSNRVLEYAYGSLIENSYGLSPLCNVAASLFGAARFFVLPAFRPERIFTVSFHESSVVLDAVCGKSALWTSLQQAMTQTGEDGQRDETAMAPFDLSQAFRYSASLKYDSVPEEFGSWGHFISLSSRIESCSTEALDGIVYRHKTCCSENLVDVSWHNPDRKSHRPQCRIIDAYERLIVQAGFAKLLKWGR